MQPSSFLNNIAQQPEFLSAVSRSDIESLINCATVWLLLVVCFKELVMTLWSRHSC